MRAAGRQYGGIVPMGLANVLVEPSLPAIGLGWGLIGAEAWRNGERPASRLVTDR